MKRTLWEIFPTILLLLTLQINTNAHAGMTAEEIAIWNSPAMDAIVNPPKPPTAEEKADALLRNTVAKISAVHEDNAAATKAAHEKQIRELEAARVQTEKQTEQQHQRAMARQRELYEAQAAASKKAHQQQLNEMRRVHGQVEKSLYDTTQRGIGEVVLNAQVGTNSVVSAVQHSVARAEQVSQKPYRTAHVSCAGIASHAHNAIDAMQHAGLAVTSAAVQTVEKAGVSATDTAVQTVVDAAEKTFIQWLKDGVSMQKKDLNHKDGATHKIDIHLNPTGDTAAPSPPAEEKTAK